MISNHSKIVVFFKKKKSEKLIKFQMTCYQRQQFAFVSLTLFFVSKEHNDIVVNNFECEKMFVCFTSFESVFESAFDEVDVDDVAAVAVVDDDDDDFDDCFVVVVEGADTLRCWCCCFEAVAVDDGVFVDFVCVGTDFAKFCFQSYFDN